MPYDITYIWNLKYYTNELTFQTETDSQTERTDLWLPRRRGGMNWEFAISRCKLVCSKRMNNKALPYSAASDIQHPMISHNEKE